MEEDEKLRMFWCHSCRYQFNANLTPGVDDINCPKCKNDFCEVYTSLTKPHTYQPYQKSLKPKKHSKYNMKKGLTSQIVRQALQQLASDSQAVKIREVTPSMIDSLKITLEG